MFWHNLDWSESLEKPLVWVHPTPWIESHHPWKVPLKQSSEPVQHLGGHGTIHMAIVFGPKTLIQQGINNLDSLCISNPKPNMLQKSRDGEPKRECTMMEGEFLVRGDGINDHLTNIEL